MESGNRESAEQLSEILKGRWRFHCDSRKQRRKKMQLPCSAQGLQRNDRYFDVLTLAI